jgi:cytochrome c-type biogenesis protein CcmH/NrfG
MIDLRVDDDTVALGHLRRLFGTWQRMYLADVQARSIEAFNADKKFAAAQELMRRMVTVLNAQIREHPDDPEVLGGVARVLATYNIDRQRALELAKRAAKLAPGNLRILDTLAECHFQSGNFDEAIAIESELVAKDPSSDDFWKQLKKFKEGKERQGK